MKPWEDPHSIWASQAAYFTWLRGSLRRMWTRFPVANAWKTSQCRANRSGGRAKWIGDCSRCGKPFAKSHLQIDHIHPAGSINCEEDIGPFILRLLSTSDNFRLVCKPCHKIITSMERFNFTDEQAEIHQRVMAFTKLSPIQQKTALTQLGLSSAGNASFRRRTYNLYLESEL